MVDVNDMFCVFFGGRSGSGWRQLAVWFLKFDWIYAQAACGHTGAYRTAMDLGHERSNLEPPKTMFQIDLLGVLLSATAVGLWTMDSRC